MKGVGLKLTPLAMRHFLGSLGMFGPLAGTSWTHIATQNSPNRG